MTYYAFTARHEPKAAAELREAGYDAFAIQMMDRRSRHRHAVKGSAKTHKWEPRPIVAFRGYVFCSDPDLWTVNKLRYVGQPVRLARNGRLCPIPQRDIDAILSARNMFFRDDCPPKIVTAKAPALIRPGDTVRFEMAAETLEAPVMSVDGHTVLVKLRRMILGLETMRVRTDIVEVVV